MSRSLTNMTADVRALVDDTNTSSDARWTTAQVELSIHRAASEVSVLLASQGHEDLISSATVTLASGVATIPANHEVKNVYLSSGTSLYKIRRGTGADRGLIGVPSEGTLVVDYIAKYSEPATSDDNVTYCGIDLDDYMIDKLTAYIAADDLKTTEGESNPQLKRVLDDLKLAIIGKYSPRVTATPVNSRRFINTNSAYQSSRWYKSGSLTIKVYT